MSGVSTFSHISSLFRSATEQYGTEGKSLLSQDMLAHKPQQTLTLIETNKLIAQSERFPAVLLGWQVRVPVAPDHPADTLFVVTGIRKNPMRKTEFRLSRLDAVDWWTTLRRGEHKKGVEFAPLRKVLHFAY